MMFCHCTQPVSLVTPKASVMLTIDYSTTVVSQVDECKQVAKRGL